MVSHNVREAVQLADRLLLIDERPATLVGDEAIALPRKDRDRSAREGLLEDLATRYRETVRF
ncbi:hypothetical protein [Breoghania sp.]|uniref:hypothetical protein n=1 Tax=Breoghania sp. TaxID=2065378 RepID=UPI0026226738|nr:hypothetical protein [Breoghania sp.]